MHLDPERKRRMTPSEVVKHHLLTMALVVDPGNGRLEHLAEAIELHPVTLSKWIAQGYIPDFQLRKLVNRFGDLAPVADLAKND